MFFVYGFGIGFMMVVWDLWVIGWYYMVLVFSCDIDGDVWFLLVFVLRYDVGLD